MPECAARGSHLAKAQALEKGSRDIEAFHCQKELRRKGDCHSVAQARGCRRVTVDDCLLLVKVTSATTTAFDNAFGTVLPFSDPNTVNNIISVRSEVRLESIVLNKARDLISICCLHGRPMLDYVLWRQKLIGAHAVTTIFGEVVEEAAR